MREFLFFIASLAGAVILTALAVLLRPELSFWKFLLWGGVGIFIACALILVFDYYRPGSAKVLLGFWKPKAAIEFKLDISRFMATSPVDNDTYKLYLTLIALKAVDITRIIVLFNRCGGYGSYEFMTRTPQQMATGEPFELVLLHYRQTVGTFWGDADKITEGNRLDRLNDDERGNRLRRSLVTDGTYYCQIVVRCGHKEERLNFTILVPQDCGRPSIFTGGADHKDYKPGRIIPAVRSFPR